MKSNQKFSLQDFLTTNFVSSISRAVASVTEAIRSGNTVDDKMLVQIATARRTMEEMKMEELPLLQILVSQTFGEMGMKMPNSVAQIFATPLSAVPTEVPKLKLVKEVKGQKSKPQAPPSGDFAGKVAAVAAKFGLNGGTQIPTAPARAFVDDDGSSKFKGWLRQLERVVEGKYNERLGTFFKGLQQFTVEIFAAGRKLNQKDWKLLFNAMKKAEEKSGQIIVANAKPAVIFKEAPPDLLNDYLFGQGEAVVSITAEICDYNGLMLAPWHSGKAGVILDMVSVLEEVLGKSEVVIDEIDLRKVRLLQKALEAKGDGPAWLVEKFKLINLQPKAEVSDGVGEEKKPMVADPDFDQAMLEAAGEVSNEPVSDPEAEVPLPTADPALKPVKTESQVFSSAKANGSPKKNKANRKAAAKAESARRAQAETVPAETESAVIQ